MFIKGGNIIEGDVQSPAETFIATGSIGVADTGGGVMSIANPFENEVLITKIIIDVTTKSTGASTVDVGIGSTATTSSDTLIDGADFGTAVGIFSSATVVAWDTDEFVTASKATGACAGLVGTYKIFAVKR